MLKRLEEQDTGELDSDDEEPEEDDSGEFVSVSHQNVINSLRSGDILQNLYSAPCLSMFCNINWLWIC